MQDLVLFHFLRHRLSINGKTRQHACAQHIPLLLMKCLYSNCHVADIIHLRTPGVHTFHSLIADESGRVGHTTEKLDQSAKLVPYLQLEFAVINNRFENLLINGIVTDFLVIVTFQTASDNLRGITQSRIQLKTRNGKSRNGYHSPRMHCHTYTSSKFSDPRLQS